MQNQILVDEEWVDGDPTLEGQRYRIKIPVGDKFGYQEQIYRIIVEGPTFDVTWTDIVADVGSPNAIEELDMDYDDNGVNCVLLVVRMGSIESGKNSVIITASIPGAPDKKNAVPLYYADKNRDPYLVASEIDGGVITAECLFIEPTYLYCTNESINRNQPYEIFKLNKPLHIRVVSKK